MNKIKNLFLKKDLATLFALISFVLAIVGMVGYFVSGATEFNPTLYTQVIVSLIIAVVLGLIGTAFESKLVRYAMFLVAFYAFIEYINSQITYIANIFVAIDGSTFSFGFLLTCISILLCFALALTSGILSKPEEELLGNHQKTTIKIVDNDKEHN